MAVFDQTPDNSEVRFASGDDILVPLLFTINGVGFSLTGYIFNSYIEIVATDGTTTQYPITITLQDQTADPGELVLSLTDIQTATLVGSYRWLLTWIDLNSEFRTLIDGTFTAVSND